jgi:acetyl-CoA synthetase
VTEQYEPRWAARGARYHYLDDLLHDVSDRCDTEVMDSNDDLSITHTSGSAGVPRGIIHRHGGYMVGTYATSKLVFNLRDEDVYWCTADLGWITGQSYVVYGALLNGATVFMYEGACDYPAPDRWWALIEKHAINILYTTPTMLRMLRRYGDEYPTKHNLESLRLLGTVGEAIDHKTWKWYYKVIGRGRCPIVDTWWQTETGMIIVSPMESMPLKPGSIGKPFPTIEASVIDMSGNELPPYTAGLLALKRPWPALMKNVLNDPQTYKDFWETVENWYVSGDLAYKDEEGYFWVRGRADDLIKSGGLRIGNVELEGALLEHPAVAEAASIGSVDPEQGEVVKAFVVLRSRWESSPELETELKDRVRKKIGPFAVPIDIKFVRALPRTMSGKILRRVLREGESK